MRRTLIKVGDTLNNPHCSMDISAKHNSKSAALHPAKVTSPNE